MASVILFYLHSLYTSVILYFSVIFCEQLNISSVTTVVCKLYVLF
jgi:hypothetical protein